MRELEKILEEIESMEYPAEGIGCGLEDISITDRYKSAEYGWNEAVERITEIIRNRMNDGWISVEDRVPKEEDYKVIVCSKQGNIDTGIYSPYTKQWFIGNISALGKDIIAWRPLPEPYHPERSDNHDRE